MTAAPQIVITLNPPVNPPLISCAILGHRFAYLTAGGIECVHCGARR